MVRKSSLHFSNFFFFSSKGGGGRDDAVSMIACHQIVKYAIREKGSNNMNPMQVASRQRFEMDKAYLYSAKHLQYCP